MVIVARASEVPEGEIRRFEFDGRPIAVARTGDRFYAFDTVCTHEECDLVDEGEVLDNELTCLCHFSVFDLSTGDVLDGPAPEPLKVYEVIADGDEIDVRI